MTTYKIEELQAEFSDEHECGPLVLILKVTADISSDYWGNELSTHMEEAIFAWLEAKEKGSSSHSALSLMRRLNLVYYISVVIVQNMRATVKIFTLLCR